MFCKSPLRVVLIIVSESNWLIIFIIGMPFYFSDLNSIDVLRGMNTNNTFSRESIKAGKVPASLTVNRNL